MLLLVLISEGGSYLRWKSSAVTAMMSAESDCVVTFVLIAESADQYRVLLAILLPPTVLPECAPAYALGLGCTITPLD